MSGSNAQQRVRVAFAGHVPELSGRLATVPGVRIVAQTDELRTLAPLLGAADPDAVYVHADACGGVQPDRVAAQLSLLAPAARLIWLADADPEDGVPPGVRCFILPADLDSAARFATAEAGDAIRTPVGVPRPLRASGRAELGPVSRIGAPVPLCRVVSVFGAKGGVGKTTLAVNLAVSVAIDDQATALIDLDLRAGCVAVHLDLLADPTLVDLACALPDVAAEQVFDFAHRHGPSGLTVITGPPRPELGDLVRTDALTRALELLSVRHRCIVADHGPGPTAETFLEVLDRSHHALLVTTLDAASLRATRLLLGALTRVRQPLRDRVAVVCNGVGGRPAIGTREAEEFLGVRFAATLPVDRGAETAVADGVPLALQPASEFSRAVQVLGRDLGLLRASDAAPRRGGPLAWLRGR